MASIADRLYDWYLQNAKYSFSGSEPEPTPIFQNRFTQTYGMPGNQKEGGLGNYHAYGMQNHLKYALQDALKPDPDTLRGYDKLADKDKPLYTIRPDLIQNTATHSHEAAHDIFNSADFKLADLKTLDAHVGKINRDILTESGHYSTRDPSMLPNEGLAYSIGSKDPEDELYVNFIASKIKPELATQLLRLHNNMKKVAK